MALTTPGEVIDLALRASGVLGVGQTALAQDVTDAFDILNLLLTEWQINRWLVWPLTDLALTSTAASSYTVGPAGSFVTASPRPDKIDAVYARLISSGEDTIMYPFMSREGFNRLTSKGTPGTPAFWFYDPGFGGTGTIFLAPVPSTLWSIHLNYKASLGQFVLTTETIVLPAPYINAMLWNLAVALRPVFQMPPDPSLEARAQRALFMMVNSIAQLPQAVQPVPALRHGSFSSMVPGGQQR